jgi:lysophospholipase L1-like esterase
MWQAILLCLFLFTAGGCGGKPQISPITRDSVILAFGDSLTAGDETAKKDSYPSRLQERLGCRVVNAGVSGELSADGVKRLPSELDDHRPQLVILCHGGNDLLNKADDASIVQSLESMIRIAKDKGADVILIGVPRPGLRLRTASFYRKIADRCGIPCDTTMIAGILSHPSMKTDYVHPNAEGNRKLAEALADLIARSAR